MNQFVCDAVMDVAAGEYGEVLGQLVTSIENGRLVYREETADSASTTPNGSCITTPTISQGIDRCRNLCVLFIKPDENFFLIF